jgi:hypothetical protein
MKQVICYFSLFGICLILFSMNERHGGATVFENNLKATCPRDTLKPEDFRKFYDRFLRDSGSDVQASVSVGRGEDRG